MIQAKKGVGVIRIISLIVVLCLFGVYINTDIRVRFHAALSSFVYPIFQVQQFFVAPLFVWAQQHNNQANVDEKIKQLEQERDQLQAEVIQLTAVQSFYQQTREIVAFKANYQTDSAILAQVLMRSLTGSRQQITVGAGSFHGVTPDMVAVYKNCLVGGVENVYPHYSTIRLITDSSCKVAAYCATSQASGIHEGCNALDVTKLEYVSHLNTIQDGDLVLSSGEGLRFPQGFGLGRVRSHKVSGLYLEVEVEPLISVSDISYCMLIMKK